MKVMSYQDIKNCLRYFGPCDAGKIQAKLGLQSIFATQKQIETFCDELVQRKEIKIADGYTQKTYKA